MATTEPTGGTRVRADDRVGRVGRGGGWDETKPFFMTSEFLALAAGVAAILIAAAMADNFDAPRAWTLVTVLGAAYMISRGLAKAGVRDPDRGRY